jgi:hypothetical protein
MDINHLWQKFQPWISNSFEMTKESKLKSGPVGARSNYPIPLWFMRLFILIQYSTDQK